MKKVFFVTITLLMVITAVGCYSLEEYLTPGNLNTKAVALVVETGVADANEFTGYANLAKARKLQTYVQSAYDLDMLILEQSREKKQLTWDQVRGVVNRDVTVSAAKGEALFGEKGIITSVLALAGFGGLTGAVGLMRKRPGDITKEDYQTALADAGIDLNVKQTQMTEIVTGVQGFFDKYKKAPADSKELVLIEELKTFLSKATDSDTKKAIAAAKA